MRSILGLAAASVSCKYCNPSRRFVGDRFPTRSLRVARVILPNAMPILIRRIASWDGKPDAPCKKCVAVRGVSNKRLEKKCAIPAPTWRKNRRNKLDSQKKTKKQKKQKQDKSSRSLLRVSYPGAYGSCI